MQRDDAEGAAGAAEQFSGDAWRLRKAAMLPGLLAAVRHRRRRRRLAASLVVAGSLLALVMLVMQWQQHAPLPLATPLDGPQLRVARVRCETVRDRPDVLARFAANATMPDDWRIDDAELQQWLAAAQRPNGLVRVGDRVVVVSEAIDALLTLQ